MRRHEWKLDRMMRAVKRSIPLGTSEYPERFFPAHLPVALIDATFGVRVRKGEKATTVAERYCRYFGIARVRWDRWTHAGRSHLRHIYTQLGTARQYEVAQLALSNLRNLPLTGR